MEKAYIVYSKRSCVSGRKLLKALKDRQVGGFSWRRSCNSPPRHSSAVTIRWGNSSLIENEGLVVNKASAVAWASNKAQMMHVFREAEIKTPQVHWPADFNSLSSSQMRFYRDRNDHVAYRSNHERGDRYAVDPINKVMELRIHVFDGSTVGVYEKIPNTPDEVIYKDANCRFRRVNTNDECQRDDIIGARPLAVKAVKALGLVSGGVDVIKDIDGNWYVLEVNSAPGLNTPNVTRFVDRFEEYIDEYL